MNNDELYHYGVLGMKWGVRRYQNKNGSLTSAGKKRYRHIFPSKTNKQKASEARKRRDYKNRGALTNAQLKQKIERLQMEKQYRELTDSEVNVGRNAVKKVLTNVGTKVATNVLTGAALYGIKAAVSRSFDRKEFANAIFNGGPKKK